MTLCVYNLKQLVLASGSCGSTFTSHFLEMVNSCVAAGCKNQVRRTRSDWEPTKHSRLCSSHFEVSCFAESLGLGKTWATLKADAVPTLLNSQGTGYKCPGTAKSKPAMRRAACKKRERARVRIFQVT